MRVSFGSGIRIQYMDSVVIPPHYDSDHLSNHPVGEKNFLIPITKMKDTNSIYIDSEPGKKDFKFRWPFCSSQI